MGSNCKIKVSLLRVLLFSILFTISRCAEEKRDFYRDYKQGHDVWRLPIIKPYQLITAACCNGWNLQSKDFNESFTVDSVNLEKNYIFIFTYSDSWSVINTTNKEVFKFDHRKNFTEFVSKIGASPKLYSTEAVYDSWRKTGQLPWAEEILQAQDSL